MNHFNRRCFLASTASVFAVKIGTAADSFEVASIKPTAPGQRGVRVMIQPGGRFNASNVTVKMLISEAYNVREFQIIGGPGWIGSEHYDITAKAEGDKNMGPEDMRGLVKSLLLERFQLKTHTQTKELATYSLLVGKSGIKMKESAAEQKGPMMRMGRGQLSGQKIKMEMLCRQLSMQLGRNVVDKTSLPGDYDFTLDFTPEEGQSFGPKEGGEAPPPPDAAGPSLFTAVQEQLGLKLEGGKGPVEVLVIDSVEKASEN